jgi:hypothetical protein
VREREIRHLITVIDTRSLRPAFKRLLCTVGAHTRYTTRGDVSMAFNTSRISRLSRQTLLASAGVVARILTHAFACRSNSFFGHLFSLLISYQSDSVSLSLSLSLSLVSLVEPIVSVLNDFPPCFFSTSPLVLVAVG